MDVWCVEIAYHEPWRSCSVKFSPFGETTIIIVVSWDYRRFLKFSPFGETTTAPCAEAVWISSSHVFGESCKAKGPMSWPISAGK